MKLSTSSLWAEKVPADHFSTPRFAEDPPQDAALAVSVDLAGAESVLVSEPDPGLDAEVDLRESVA